MRVGTSLRFGPIERKVPGRGGSTMRVQVCMSLVYFGGNSSDACHSPVGTFGCSCVICAVIEGCEQILRHKTASR
ncbi:hypothetical protein CY35_09G071500 [Sphagnum magellanicum]|nr:hypothetical protein CY35_09G071500 [Sphagnum magellanicum]